MPEKKERSVRLDDDVIGTIEPFALVAVGDDGDGTIGFQAGHLLGGMLTGD